MSRQEYMDRVWENVITTSKTNPMVSECCLKDYNAKISLGWPHARVKSFHTLALT